MGLPTEKSRYGFLVTVQTVRTCRDSNTTSVAVVRTPSQLHPPQPPRYKRKQDVDSVFSVHQRRHRICPDAPLRFHVLVPTHTHRLCMAVAGSHIYDIRLLVHSACTTHLAAFSALFVPRAFCSRQCIRHTPAPELVFSSCASPFRAHFSTSKRRVRLQRYHTSDRIALPHLHNPHALGRA